MAIVYPITLPAVPAPRRARLFPRATVAVSESPFSRVQQAQAHPGELWGLEVEWPPMSRAQAEPLLAALLALKGRFGTFFYGDPDGRVPRGSAASNPGTPLVAGAGQTGNALVLDGAPANAAGYLKAGDYVQLGSGTNARLYKALEDASADAAGNVALTIWPALRSAPADNQPAIVSGAVGAFRLASNEVSWESDERGVYALSVSASEAL